ncbi:universal stress protein [Sandaracinobacter sp. RS1-74]|uniref:universal stress protein n=1 Tax=Sandaracinobacteroides sayramensis TaxID=2913411 RepID=UPI001EDBDBF8|nr:universal stress protein [Sandaracinobacteroides sayramensis]MCG2842511.1 universal stress protein [Sandaracinobacteroides sayramensis]
MKSILLHVAEDAHFESRLQGALDLVRFTGGHLECLQTRRVPGFLGADAGGFAGSAAMVVQLMEDEARLAEAERQKLTARLQGEGVPFSFVEAMGEPGQTLVDRSLLADVIVMTQPGASGSDRDLAQALAAVVTHADAPVLAVPETAKRVELEKPVLVAWKPTKEAAHAVKRSVTLLKKAARVDIVTIDPTGSGDFPPLAVASYLSRHGIKAELHERTAGGGSTSDTLLATARELGSGLLVMGGYGRSRAMEFLLGGVTRRLLSASDVPLLMAH